jgi:hypothetical protein
MLVSDYQGSLGAFEALESQYLRAGGVLCSAREAQQMILSTVK